MIIRTAIAESFRRQNGLDRFLSQLFPLMLISASLSCRILFLNRCIHKKVKETISSIIKTLRLDSFYNVSYCLWEHFPRLSLMQKSLVFYFVRLSFWFNFELKKFDLFSIDAHFYFLNFFNFFNFYIIFLRSHQ